MDEFAELTVDELADAITGSGLPYPNETPYRNITAALVAWNEEARLGPLLAHLRPYFERVVVGVQESTDNTLEIAKAGADIVVTDTHRGFGDATFGPRVLPQVNTRWTLKVDADEWPNADLLETLGWATAYMRRINRHGAWVPFHSAIEGNEYTEQHSHLRLFVTGIGWPNTLHSRPMTNNTIRWPFGYFRHDRSLDEMMRDYISYYAIGRGNPGWDRHNTLMMHDACVNVASTKGWDFVRSFEWWPKVEAIAFTEESPWQL